MTDTEKEGFDFADLVSRELEEILVRYFGNDAAWINAEMSRTIPDELLADIGMIPQKEREQIFKSLWKLRQESNDVAHYIQENPIKSWEEEYKKERDRNQVLLGEIEAIRRRATLKYEENKAELLRELKGVELVLRAIKDGRSSHWQKKENIRLALEILSRIPSSVRDEFPYSEDF